MKKIFRLLATILICAFVLSSVNLSALNQTIRDEFNAQAELIESLRSYSSDYYRNTLTNVKEVELYDRVLTAMLYRKSECSFYFTDSAELNKIAIYVCLDNPFLTITNQYMNRKTDMAIRMCLNKPSIFLISLSVFRMQTIMKK